jgi:NAD(P)H-dependent FMN reductase
MAKIALISGSHRIAGNSGRIAEVFAKRIQNQLGHETYVLDLAKNPLPLWDEGLWGAAAPEGYSFADWQKVWGPVASALEACDAVVLFAPEYNGTVPAALKNFLHIAGSAEQTLAHKAGLLVSVSASANGAYPIAELRQAALKNCKLVAMPDHLIIRNAGQMFLAETPAEVAEAQAYMDDRLTYTLDVFEEYRKALNAVRASGKTPTKKYQFGM